MSVYLIERLTSPAEIDAIIEVEAACFINPWTREMHLRELDNAGVSCLYAARDASGLIVGFCSTWRVLDELHINNLAIAPPARRLGIATALISHALTEAAVRGATRATLEVRRSNDAARRLYERFGFTEAGVRKGYYTDPLEDALVLWREAPGQA